MSELSDRLDALSREATEGISLLPIELALRSRSRRRRRLALSAGMIVAAVGITTGLALTRPDPRQVQVTTGPTSAAGAIPWIDKPAFSLGLPTPIPTTAPPADAPACKASQITMSLAGGNGAGGHTEQWLTFTNVSHTTCLLAGYPKVVATQPGRPPVTAQQGDFFGDPGATANLAPGDTAKLTLDTNDICTDTPFASQLIYGRVTVYLPGGSKSLADSLDLVCGLSESRFGVPQTPIYPPPSPLFQLRASMELPASVRPGQILNYVIDLTNPTANPIDLNPCPGYLEAASEAAEQAAPGRYAKQGLSPVPPVVVAKGTYALNCAASEISPNETLRFAMRLQISPSAMAGPAEIHWTLAISPGAAPAEGTIDIQP